MIRYGLPPPKLSSVWAEAGKGGHGRPQLFWKGGGGGGGARIGQGGRHLTAVNTLSAFDQFNEPGGKEKNTK